ncbi:MAG: hypothetical protein F4Y16_11235 [Holophagales bacterium]|nr:hypothetical protein [Holophagales bacterium]MYH26382.1 hypothetical protein [Holophagales bacterium]
MTLVAIVGLVGAVVVGVRAASAAKEASELRAERDGLRVEVVTLEQRLSEAEEDQGIDLPPCLGRAVGGGVHTLFRITVNHRRYSLERLWDGTAVEHETVPNLLKELPAGELSADDLLERGKRLYALGDQADTFGGRCRFYVELKRGPSTSRDDYLDARHLVEMYFFFSNSSEVRRESVRGGQ